MKEKIQQLEDEIRELCKNHKEEVKRAFWDFHIKPVIEISKEMAEKYDADIEVVWLSAILHGIARLNDEDPHDEIGAKKAEEILNSKGFSEEMIKKVSRGILTHRCRKYLPENLEEKILASADAISHFKVPFYLWHFKFSQNKYVDIFSKNLEKIDRDFNEKIFFADEKEMIRKEYEVLIKWFEYEL